MWEGTVRAILDAIRERFWVAGTVGYVIQRAIAEKAVELFRVGCLVAREILTFTVAVIP